MVHVGVLFVLSPADTAEEAEEIETVHGVGAFVCEAHALGMPLHRIDRKRGVVEGFDYTVQRAPAVYDKTVSKAAHRLVMAAVVGK